MDATGIPAIAVSAGFTDYGDYLGLALSRPLVAARAVPFLLPYLEDQRNAPQVLDRVDGLVLGFGRDIAPERYGASPHRP
jgi:gamma-glutamyl-gamma-aminobutyrate hydrolase PuuD